MLVTVKNILQRFAQISGSHMPYLLPGSDEALLFFCLRNSNGAWRLHKAGRDGMERVETALPEAWNECCPVAVREDGALRLTFVAGPAAAGAERNCLMSMPDASAGYPPDKLELADVGFARQAWRVYAGRRGPLRLERGRDAWRLEIKGLDYLYRVCPDAWEPARLLITASIEGRDRSLAYSLLDGSMTEYSFNGESLYKFCSAGAAGWLYAQRGEGDFEDRDIRFAAAGEVQASNASDLAERVDDVDSQGMDCVRCFRKHVAAALSYAKEVLSGHGEGGEPDHRADLEGELAGAEAHAAVMDLVPGYAPALRELRHALEGRAWRPEDRDLALLRRMWKSSMGLVCGCGRRRKGV